MWAPTRVALSVLVAFALLVDRVSFCCLLALAPLLPVAVLSEPEKGCLGRIWGDGPSWFPSTEKAWLRSGLR